MLVCSDPKTPTEVRGHLFKDIVTAGLVTKGLSSDDLRRILTSANVTRNDDRDAKLKRPTHKIELRDYKFPSYVYWSSRTPYCFIPNGFKSFPAIDLILVLRKIVIVFSFHMSDDHEDVTPTVMSEVLKAIWKQKYVDKIIVLYLSPSDETRRKLEKKIGRTRPSSCDSDWVVTRFYSFHEFRFF